MWQSQTSIYHVISAYQKDKPMRKTCICVAVVMLMLSIAALTTAVNATSDTRRFSLSHFDIEVTYPASVKPGDTATVSVSATSKASTYVRDLIVEILVPSTGGDLRLVTSISVVRETSVRSGDRFSRTATVTVPTDTPRSFMMATASENVRTYYYSYYYPYTYPYYRWSHNQSYYWYWWPVYYSYRTYSDSVETGIAPLSYVLATTPEYIQLKADYDRLSEDYTELTDRYARLQTDYDNVVAKNESLDAALAMTRIALIAVVVAVAVVTVVLLLQKQGKIVIRSPVAAKGVKA